LPDRFQGGGGSFFTKPFMGEGPGARAPPPVFSALGPVFFFPPPVKVFFPWFPPQNHPPGRTSRARGTQKKIWETVFCFFVGKKRRFCFLFLPYTLFFFFFVFFFVAVLPPRRKFGHTAFKTGGGPAGGRRLSFGFWIKVFGAGGAEKGGGGPFGGEIASEGGPSPGVFFLSFCGRGRGRHTGPSLAKKTGRVGGPAFDERGKLIPLFYGGAARGPHGGGPRNQDRPGAGGGNPKNLS